MISSISSFDIINVSCFAKSKGCPDFNIFYCIPASATDAAAVNPNGIKTLLANNLSTFPIKGKPVFSNGLTSLPRNPPNCTVLES